MIEFIVIVSFMLWVWGLLVWLAVGGYYLLENEQLGGDRQKGARMLLATPIYPVFALFILFKYAFPQEEVSDEGDDGKPERPKKVMHRIRPRGSIYTSKSSGYPLPKYDSPTREPK